MNNVECNFLNKYVVTTVGKCDCGDYVTDGQHVYLVSVDENSNIVAIGLHTSFSVLPENDTVIKLPKGKTITITI